MASITSSAVVPVTAKTVSTKQSSASMAARSPIKTFGGLKSASLFTKTEVSPFVSNGYNTSAMLVWTPNNNKFFETLSFLPPLSAECIAKQIAYMTSKGFTPCLEFADGEHAYTTSHGNLAPDSRSSSGYYDNRYWTMWKLPMFGCTDPSQVLAEIEACKQAFPNAYIRVAGFDRVRQVQVTGLVVHRPVPPIPTDQRSV